MHSGEEPIPFPFVYFSLALPICSLRTFLFSSHWLSCPLSLSLSLSLSFSEFLLLLYRLDCWPLVSISQSALDLGAQSSVLLITSDRALRLTPVPSRPASRNVYIA